jgi:hypothetical protein
MWKSIARTQLVLICVLSIAVVVSASQNLACNSAAAPIFSQVEQTVLSDIEAGKTDAQIEQDVASLLGEQLFDAGAVTEEVVVVVQDAVAVLIDLGVIPPQFAPFATALHQRESEKVAAKKGVSK